MYIQTLMILVSLCSLASKFESQLVANPKEGSTCDFVNIKSAIDMIDGQKYVWLNLRERGVYKEKLSPILALSD